MRNKLPEETKKTKFSISIDDDLNILLEEYLEYLCVNKSKYIEHLVRKDLEERGEDVEKEF